MPDTPSHFSVSSPSLSKGLPFFATLASVKPGVNYGPIINVAGLPFSWTPSGYEPSSGTFTFPTLSSLLSTAPQPGMRATALDAPWSMLFEIGGKWGGSLGHFASWDDLPSVATLADGACATFPQLVGGGRVRVNVESGRWAVCVGEVFARISEPYAVLSVATLDSVSIPLYTLPGGIIGNSEVWEHALPAQTPANAGNDAIRLVLAGIQLSVFQILPTSSNPHCTQYAARASAVAGFTTCDRINSQNQSTARSSVSLKLTLPITVAALYTPATVGNSVAVTYAFSRRIA